MKIINLFGGPGVGKSTQAALLFSKLKMAGYNAELVTEYAKEATWEERKNVLTQDQLYIFAKQHRRILRLINKVEFAIVDSPLIMGLCYVPEPYFEHFTPLVKEVWDQYENINYILERSTSYHSIGRNQTEEQARNIDKRILELLDRNSIAHRTLNIAENDVAEIIYQEIITQGR